MIVPYKAINSNQYRIIKSILKEFWEKNKLKLSDELKNILLNKDNDYHR